MEEVWVINHELDSAKLHRCCASSKWIEKMLALKPFKSLDHMLSCAKAVDAELGPEDWLEAFKGHPCIGTLKKNDPKAHSGWESSEQSGMLKSETSVAESLAALNPIYAEKFGYIFIVCATGKSAAEMLQLLKSRLENTPEDELHIAAAEQGKITQLRLVKLISELSTHREETAKL